MNIRIIQIIQIILVICVFIFSKSSIANNMSDILSSAKRGNLNSQFQAGDMYLRGDLVKINKEKAYYWFNKAAEKGHTGAQVIRGLMYYRGEGEEKNYNKSLYWFRKAAKKNSSFAQYKMGLMNYYGKGTEKNYDEAIYWLDLANNAGYKDAEQLIKNFRNKKETPHSQYKTGMKYYHGNSVRKNRKEAAFWFKKSAERGHPGAQFNLGIMYLNGRGVNLDVSEAYYWYKKAADQNLSEAKNAIAMLETAKKGALILGAAAIGYALASNSSDNYCFRPDDSCSSAQEKKQKIFYLHVKENIFNSSSHNRKRACTDEDYLKGIIKTLGFEITRIGVSSIYAAANGDFFGVNEDVTKVAIELSDLIDQLREDNCY